MNLIRIGDKYINIDNVCDIWNDHTEVNVYLNTVKGSLGRDGEGYCEQVSLSFHGDDASALRAWLTRNSADIATENNNHRAALDLAQELCDVLGAMEVADEAHAHELLTGLIDTYWHPLRLALDATKATGS